MVGLDYLWQYAMRLYGTSYCTCAVEFGVFAFVYWELGFDYSFPTPPDENFTDVLLESTYVFNKSEGYKYEYYWMVCLFQTSY